MRVESEPGKGSTFYFTASFDRQEQKIPFKEPELAEALETSIGRESSEKEKKMGSPKQLLELLSTIEPFLRKGKPKQCKEIMAEISRFDWPDEHTKEISELGRLIGKYKFKQAPSVFESIMEKLKTDENKSP